MGFRKASGTKPSMLAEKVPNVEEEQQVEVDIQESAPKETMQKMNREPAQTGNFLEAEFDVAEQMPTPPSEALPEATPSPTPAPSAIPSPTPAPEAQKSFLDQEYEIGAPQKTAYDQLRNNFEPFEGSFAGIKFKRDKIGQLYYYQTPARGSFESAKLGIMPSEAERQGGWQKIDKMPDSLKSYLNIGSTAWLDEPEILTGVAMGMAAAPATAGMSLIPALLTEVATGVAGGYLGGRIASGERFQEKLRNPEDAKALIFLEDALKQPEMRPTSPAVAAIGGGLASAIPGAAQGMAHIYNQATKNFALIMAKAKPRLANAINSLNDFAESIGVKFNGYDVARQVDPQIETKVQMIERGEFDPLSQNTMITQSDSNLIALNGLVDITRAKFAPQAEELLAGPKSIGKLTEKEILEEDPFSKTVMKRRKELNFFEVMQENERTKLKINAKRGRELAMGMKVQADGLLASVEDIMAQSFSSFKELRDSGLYSGAELINQFKIRNPQEAMPFAKLYNNLMNMTQVMPSALRQSSDFAFVDTQFDALLPENFQSTVIQEQLSLVRRPIEPGAVGYQRPDLPERAYYVTGGPAGQPGAQMPLMAMPQYIPGEGMRRTGVAPSGVSAEVFGAGTQVQESLFQTPVGSAAGPRAVESPAKQFLGPKPGGASGRGLTFDQINELTNQAQKIVESLKTSGDTKLIGAANTLEKAFRNFEDDSVFKIAAVRGDEDFALQVLRDKETFANNERLYTEYGTIFNKSIDQWSGSMLRLHPDKMTELWGMFNDAQKEQLKGLILDKTYQDSVYSLLESGVNTRFNPQKIIKNIMNTPTSRENLKTIFGEGFLKDMDKVVKIADFVNATGQYKATEKETTNAIIGILRRLPYGANVGDFFGAMFMGNPTAEQVVSTTIKNWESLIRKPSGGIVGKTGQAYAKFGEKFGMPGRAAFSGAAKIAPQIKRAVKRKSETEEPTFGEMGQ